VRSRELHSDHADVRLPRSIRGAGVQILVVIGFVQDDAR